LLHHLLQDFRLIHSVRLKEEKKEGEGLGGKNERNGEFGGKRLNRDNRR
jgi:hypothetical protein